MSLPFWVFAICSAVSFWEENFPYLFISGAWLTSNIESMQQSLHHVPFMVKVKEFSGVLSI